MKSSFGSDVPASIPPNVGDCAYLVGAEYVAALLEDEPQTASTLGKLLILLSSYESERHAAGDAKSKWPGVVRAIIDDVTAPLTGEQRAKIENDKLVKLNLSDSEIRKLEQGSGGAISAPGTLDSENFVDRLLAGQVKVDGLPVEI